MWEDDYDYMSKLIWDINHDDETAFTDIIYGEG